MTHNSISIACTQRWMLVDSDKWFRNRKKLQKNFHFLLLMIGTSHTCSKIIFLTCKSWYSIVSLKNTKKWLRFEIFVTADQVELERGFIASLLAHAFFSTFPKRTIKTHPTLQDFNFTNFFRHLNMWGMRTSENERKG